MSDEHDEEYGLQLGPGSLKIKQTIPVGSQILCSLAVFVCRSVGAMELAGRLVEMQVAHGDAFIATQQATVIAALTQSSRAMQGLEETQAMAVDADEDWKEIASEATARSQVEANSIQLISESAAVQPMAQGTERLFGAGVFVSVRPTESSSATQPKRLGPD